MRVSSGALGAVLLAGAIAVGASGCKIEASGASVTKFNASPVIMDEAWTPGGNVVINGVYGEIDVVEGAADVVTVTFEPFHYWAHDEEDEARQMLADHIELVVEPRSDGGVHVSTGRTGGGSTGIGADIRVELPVNFDSALTVTNDSNGDLNPGNIDVRFVGGATAVSVSTDALGDCDVNGAASVVSTTVSCDGQVEVSGVSDQVSLTSTGIDTNVSLQLSVASVSDTSPGGTVDADDGDVLVSFPSVGNYSILARTEEGMVDEGTLPSSCVLTETDPPDPRAKTVTCGTGGPQYSVNACNDGVGECNITISYQ